MIIHNNFDTGQRFFILYKLNWYAMSQIHASADWSCYNVRADGAI